MEPNNKKQIELTGTAALQEIAEFASQKLRELGARETIILYRTDDELRGRIKCSSQTQARVALKLLIDSGMPMMKMDPEEAKSLFGFVLPEDDQKEEP